MQLVVASLNRLVLLSLLFFTGRKLGERLLSLLVCKEELANTDRQSLLNTLKTHARFFFLCSLSGSASSTSASSGVTVSRAKMSRSSRLVKSTAEASQEISEMLRESRRYGSYEVEVSLLQCNVGGDILRKGPSEHARCKQKGSENKFMDHLEVTQGFDVEDRH